MAAIFIRTKVEHDGSSTVEHSAPVFTISWDDHGEAEGLTKAPDVPFSWIGFVVSSGV